MQNEQTIDLILEQGVLSFDGRVVEAFGFSFYDQTLRSHIAKIQRIEMDPGGRHADPSVTINSGRAARPITVYYQPERAAEVEAFVDAVRRAAPQLDA